MVVLTKWERLDRGWNGGLYQLYWITHMQHELFLALCMNHSGYETGDP